MRNRFSDDFAVQPRNTRCNGLEHNCSQMFVHRVLARTSGRVHLAGLHLPPSPAGLSRSQYSNMMLTPTNHVLSQRKYPNLMRLCVYLVRKQRHIFLGARSIKYTVKISWCLVEQCCEAKAVTLQFG